MSVHRYAVLGAVATLLVFTGPTPAAQAASTGVAQIIQAVPNASVQVTIDGRRVRQNVGEGAVLGPYSLSSGKHSVSFFDPSADVLTAGSLTVRDGSHTDVVLHRPAALSGEPVVNVYRTPRQSIGPGKARLLIAHTATVAPPTYGWMAG
jgi:hypothetical protein